MRRDSSIATAVAWASSQPTSTDDGRVDLYVANDTTANYLFRNLGGFRFEEIGLTSGVAANASGGYQAGMGVAAGDSDGDGRIDLVVTNFYGESTTLSPKPRRLPLRRQLRQHRIGRADSVHAGIRDLFPRRQQ